MDSEQKVNEKAQVKKKGKVSCKAYLLSLVPGILTFVESETLSRSVGYGLDINVK